MNHKEVYRLYREEGLTLRRRRLKRRRPALRSSTLPSWPVPRMSCPSDRPWSPEASAGSDGDPEIPVPGANTGARETLPGRPHLSARRESTEHTASAR